MCMQTLSVSVMLFESRKNGPCTWLLCFALLKIYSRILCLMSLSSIPNVTNISLCLLISSKRCRINVCILIKMAYKRHV